MRRRRGAAAGAALLALACSPTPYAAAQDAGEPHLPTVVNAPGTWSDSEGVTGPVAALGIATRTRPDGLLDERQSLGVFAVSALDGRASWLRPPGLSLDRWGFIGGFAVSPDGRWVGWVRPSGRSGVRGWSVVDTETGRVRRLEVAGHDRVRRTTADLAFSGDSRYLLTSYELRHQPETRGHQLVAWDVTDGTPTLVEPPGHYWLPELGSAPSGVVWSRGRQVFRADPGTGDLTTVRMPRHVVEASWAPDDTGFAYLGRRSVDTPTPWRLYVGPTVAAARNNVVPLPRGLEPSQLLGWRDSTHVVVGHHRHTVHVVDIVTGEVEEIDLAGHGDQVNAPYLAEGLWQQPLAAPEEPEGLTDPRRPWRWSGGAAVLALGGGFLWRRRARVS